MLRTDNGTEYLNLKFEEYMKTHGVRHQTTVPYTPQQNGVAERWNRTLLETARSLLHGAGPNVPQSLWGEAVAAATLIRNCCPTKGVSTLKTPHELFYGLILMSLISELGAVAQQSCWSHMKDPNLGQESWMVFWLAIARPRKVTEFINPRLTNFLLPGMLDSLRQNSWNRKLQKTMSHIFSGLSNGEGI